jgi:TolB-like protein
LNLFAAPAKCIAVLPVENLSVNPHNTFFGDGVQDGLTTDLARITDLKVTSRTSVTACKSRAARNLHEIGQQPDVAHALEGSVHRSANVCAFPCNLSMLKLVATFDDE